MICRCRFCNKKYQETDSTADCKGYCGQSCVGKMAKHLGCKEMQKAKEHLQLHKEVGNLLAPAVDFN